MQEPRVDDALAAIALLRFLAEVLDDMAGRIIRLEAHAADMIGTSPRRSDLLVVLQDFDLVRQMIEDCARLCTAASRDGDGTRRDLAGLLHLETLRTRLLDQNHPENRRARRPGGDGGPGGAVDLFGSG